MNWKDGPVPGGMPPVSRTILTTGRALACCVLTVAVLLVASPSDLQSADSVDDGSATSAPVEQPIPYSHKTHVALGLQCRDCHRIADPGFAAGYPSEATCMACHAAVKIESPHIQKLATFSANGQPVPWNRVYRVPDFVWFSHASHVEDASVGCETCHGEVASRDVLFQEEPTTMASCMECHARHSAPNDCDFCHDPG